MKIRLIKGDDRHGHYAQLFKAGGPLDQLKSSKSIFIYIGQA